MKYIARPVTVEASVITTVTPSPGGDMICILADGTQRTATEDMLARMTPQPGDYWVEQSDGYQYLNPKEVFERKYKPATSTNMTFGDAIDCTRFGVKVARQGWNGKGMWVHQQVPDAHSKMTLPYLYMKTAQGDLVPWLASQTDMLANDWEIVWP